MCEKIYNGERVDTGIKCQESKSYSKVKYVEVEENLYSC